VIVEPGKVMAVEADGVWVETANQSACSRCAARKGCGQSLLAQVDGHRSYIKVRYAGYAASDFKEGDAIEIGVDESAVLRGSLLVYCTPLIGLLGGALLGNILFGGLSGNSAAMSELATVLTAGIGLLLGAASVRWLSSRQCNDQRFQPVVVGIPGANPVHLVGVEGRAVVNTPE
jgi:sigma-E factor negative regulatory protein RseC